MLRSAYIICAQLDGYSEISRINLGFLSRDLTTDLTARKFISMAV